MKITRMVTSAVAATVIAAVGFAGAPVASAYPNVGKLGSEITMTDSVGQVVLSWKVSNLGPSSDTVPGLPVSGKLWAADATVKSIQGSVTPQIPNFNAVAPNEAAYRVLWQAYTPQGISGATIAQGQQSSGKIYFDVTGPAPTTVTLNNGMEDLIIWTP
ncbi:MAG: MPT63 family protein [Mycobacterium sp.]